MGKVYYDYTITRGYIQVFLERFAIFFYPQPASVLQKLAIAEYSNKSQINHNKQLEFIPGYDKIV